MVVSQSGIQQSRDVRMGEPRQQLALARETGAGMYRHRERAEQFHPDLRLVQTVDAPAAPNAAHAALTNRLDQPIVAAALTRLQMLTAQQRLRNRSDARRARCIMRIGRRGAQEKSLSTASTWASPCSALRSTTRKRSSGGMSSNVSRRPNSSPLRDIQINALHGDLGSLSRFGGTHGRRNFSASGR